MINLPADALAALEKTVKAEDEFISLLKGLSVGMSGNIQVSSISMSTLHSNLILHLVANLIDAEIRITQLEAQLDIINANKEK